MFGVTKYTYRPNIGIYNVRLWTGLRGKRFALAANPQIKSALAKNKLFTEVYFETDSFGFKKTEFTWTPTSFPIFFLGDSFTEGLWVAPKETFVNLVGVKLQRAVPSIAPINLGVDGYSALEEDWMLEHYAPILHPKIVVANLFPNDVHIDYLQVLRGEGIPDSNYTAMFYYLQRMKDFCEREGITLAIAVIPAKEQFDELRGFSVFHHRVEEWCNKQGIVYLDPRSYFEKTDVDTDYFYWDPHFSPRGHAVYADYLSQHLATLIISKDTLHI
jgi:lysophospholipase L1-like esterase